MLGIDLVERLALADDRAFAEQPAQDDAGNLRPDLGHLVSRDPARKLLLERGAALLDDDVADLDGTLRAAAPAGAPAASLPPEQAAISSADANRTSGDMKISPATHFLLMTRIARPRVAVAETT